MEVFRLFTLLLAIGGAFSRDISHEALEEGHRIMKRFAEHGEQEITHTIAHVMHERELNVFHRISKRDLRSVMDRETSERFRLDFASGSSLHLNLRKRSMFSSNTVFKIRTEQGELERENPPEDCYASGIIREKDGSEGIAAVALCNGMHGSVSIGDTEHYIHPVEADGGLHTVHVLTRRGTERAFAGTQMDYIVDSSFEDELLHERSRRDVNADTYKTATSLVIELAIHADAKFYSVMKTKAPGREDEFILYSMAGAQALYSDRRKVGYDVAFKIKLLEYWETDPKEYEFKEKMRDNLFSYCQYTKTKYKDSHFDIHYINTGVTQDDDILGLAYLRGVCRLGANCASQRGTSWSRSVVDAHEIGHVLGFNHGEYSCPEEIQDDGGSFMGGINRYNFTECKRYELNRTLANGKTCMFEEKANATTPQQTLNLPPVALPGQYGSPRDQCRRTAGEDFDLFRPFDLEGDTECLLWMCLNRNKSSSEYLKVHRQTASYGYPCNEEKFCYNYDNKCVSWDDPRFAWDADYLRPNKREFSWSPWSDNWSDCSKDCGSGIQTKTRRCNIPEGIHVTPHCRGESVRYRVCNTGPCPSEEGKSADSIRQQEGNRICARFLKNGVKLNHAYRLGETYLSTAKDVQITDRSKAAFETTSCMVQCKRSNGRRGDVDAIYPDGTPCKESDKRESLRLRHQVQLRCVNGKCLEMSDCPNNEKKDHCGICGGDETYCHVMTIDSSFEVPTGGNAVFATIPSGSKSIDISLESASDSGVYLQLWDANGNKIFGSSGQFPENQYTADNAVDYAGTKWVFDQDEFIRADGTIDQELTVKIYRTGEKSVKKGSAVFLKPLNDM